MVAGLTVEERIIRNVESTLAAIVAGASYNTTVRAVRRQEASPRTVSTWPAVIVVHGGHGGTGEHGEGGFNSTVTRQLKLLVYGCLNANQDTDWPGKLELLASDIENALRADLQRGDDGTGQRNAHMTAIADKAIFDQTEMGGAGVAAVELQVLVTFRHLLTDTTSAI